MVHLRITLQQIVSREEVGPDHERFAVLAEAGKEPAPDTQGRHSVGGPDLQAGEFPGSLQHLTPVFPIRVHPASARCSKKGPHDGGPSQQIRETLPPPRPTASSRPGRNRASLRLATE